MNRVMNRDESNTLRAGADIPAVENCSYPKKMRLLRRVILTFPLDLGRLEFAGSKGYLTGTVAGISVS